MKYTHVNHRIGVGHHSNEQIEEHDDVDDGVRTKHEQAPEPGVTLDAGQLEVLQANHAEGRPEERLRGFEDADRKLLG